MIYKRTDTFFVFLLVFFEINFLNAQVDNKNTNQAGGISSVDSRLSNFGGRGYPNLPESGRFGNPPSNYPGNSFQPNGNQNSNTEQFQPGYGWRADTQNLNQGRPLQEPARYPDNYPENYPSTYPNNYPNNYPVNYPNNYPGNYPNNYPGNYPNNYPGDGSYHQGPNNFSPNYNGDFRSEPNQQANYYQQPPNYNAPGDGIEYPSNINRPYQNGGMQSNPYQPSISLQPVGYPTQDNQYPTQNNQYPTQNNQYPTQNNQYPSQNNQYPTQNNQYPSQNNQYPTQNNQYPTQNNQYPTQNNQYPSQNNQYTPQGNFQDNQNLKPDAVSPDFRPDDILDSSMKYPGNTVRTNEHPSSNNPGPYNPNNQNGFQFPYQGYIKQDQENKNPGSNQVFQGNLNNVLQTGPQAPYNSPIYSMNGPNANDSAAISGDPVFAPSSNSPSGQGMFVASTESPAQRQCELSCPTTSEYNPVCGTNNVTYDNPGRLYCARNCGVAANLRVAGRCPTAK